MMTRIRETSVYVVVTICAAFLVAVPPIPSYPPPLLFVLILATATIAFAGGQRSREP